MIIIDTNVLLAFLLTDCITRRIITEKLEIIADVTCSNYNSNPNYFSIIGHVADKVHIPNNMAQKVHILKIVTQQVHNR